ncbi:MAG: MBL fold metallo-hydrolase [Deltaproteobacteria bacterium]|nr:MBL fold metallo-hydrolase [Deltaproteobacteria bacterium]
MTALKRELLVVGPLQCNCSIIYDEKTREAIVIDPGDEVERIRKTLEREGLSLKCAVHTHAHFDHVGATGGLKRALPGMQIALHRDDEDLYRNLPMQGQLFGFHFEAPPPVDKFLVDEEDLSVGGHKFSVLHTPGHSPGGVCLRFEAGLLSETPVLFSGDTLFQRSIGRTDFWGGDYRQLINSIRDRLLTLDDETFVQPGHGPDTTIGVEARSNPFLK